MQNSKDLITRLAKMLSEANKTSKNLRATLKNLENVNG